jgi:replication factor A1
MIKDFLQELRKRDITIVDKSMAEINLTMWGGNAENFDPTGNPVVAIKGAKVSDYNGVSLSTLGSSVIQVILSF